MGKKLAGTIFAHNAVKFDYCIKESIESLLGFCDHVYALDAGSDDGTDEIINSFDERVTKIILPRSEWDAQEGREKLNYFTNIAIRKAQDDGFEYQFNLQADEIVHERSYQKIRQAIEKCEESYFSTRINLWKSPYLMLNVEHNRKPCSTEIIRLAKTIYRSVGDAESIGVPSASLEFINDIRIYHMGFVRDRKIMKYRSIHMQQEIFKIEYDKKLDGIDYFEPDRWFDPEKDLVLINEPLPEVIKDWAAKRLYKD